MMSEAGTEQTGPRSMGEIEDTFSQMLTGAEEQPKEDSSEEEQTSTDSLDTGQENAELADDSVVDEQYDEELDDEQLGSESQTFTVTHLWIPSLRYIHKKEPGTRTATRWFRCRATGSTADVPAIPRGTKPTPSADGSRQQAAKHGLGRS